MKRKILFRALSFVIFLCLILNTMSIKSLATKGSNNDVNYAEALQLSLYFYDANRCGSGITDAAITWRGDCHIYDSNLSLSNTNLPQDFVNEYKDILDPDGDGKIDVSGGFHDAGDHIKCAQTIGFSLTTLNLGYYEFPEAYEKTQTKTHLESITKEFCDYIMKCTYLDQNNEVIAFCYQVGDASDHSHWEAPEGQTINRPAFFAYKGNYGTEQAMQCAAGLASTSVTMRNTNKEYSKKCMKYAKALYDFGMKYKGSTQNHDGYFYASTNGYDDDVAWAQVWMYIASGDTTYLEQAKNANINDGWIHCWDKVWGGYVALMADVTKEQKYIDLLSQNIERLKNSYSTPAGYICIGDWGSARNNSAWQTYAVMYTKITGNTKYLQECEKQMQYILGDNPMGRSYLIGYSNNYAKYPHHRGVSCQNSNVELIGALVGGPNSNDQHNDSKDDYVQNEVAIDYNAPFVTAAAGLYSLVGIKNGDTPITINKTEINAEYYKSEYNEDIKTNYKINNGIIYAIPRNTTLEKFLENITTNLSIEIYSKDNKVINNETELIKTKMKAKIGDNIYTLAVRGDIDGNGIITITDLVKVKLYSVNIKPLTDIEKIAADINYDNEITITDVVNVALMVVGLR